MGANILYVDTAVFGNYSGTWLTFLFIHSKQSAFALFFKKKIKIKFLSEVAVMPVDGVCHAIYATVLPVIL